MSSFPSHIKMLQLTPLNAKDHCVISFQFIFNFDTVILYYVIK